MVIDAESESEEEPRAEQILHGNFEHAPPICRLLWRLVADQPEQTASREKYEKHPEQELDEHGGKTNQPEESERRRNNGQNKKRRRPSKHGKPRIFLASSPPETCMGSLSSGTRALPTELCSEVADRRKRQNVGFTSALRAQALPQVNRALAKLY
jgi:hypothetical protein